jgi:Holliday junction resolvasome RuvABC endonuclease subunit
MTGVAGIDPSLTCTAYLFRNEATKKCTPCTIMPAKLRGPVRLAYLLDTLRRVLVMHDPGLVVVEGYAFGARNGREAQGEWGGLIRWELFRLGIPYLVVPPTTLKLYAAGTGKAPDLITAVWKRWRYETSSDDIADAYALMRLGLELTTAVAKPTKGFDKIVAGCELYAVPGAVIRKELRAVPKNGALEGKR